MSLLRFIALIFSIALGAAPVHAVVVPASAIVDADFGGDDGSDAGERAGESGEERDDERDDDDDDERGLWNGALLDPTVFVAMLRGDEREVFVARAGQRLLRPPR